MGGCRRPGGDAQGSKIDPIAGQIESGLHGSIHRLGLAPRHVQVRGAGRDAISLRRIQRRGDIADEEGNIVGLEVERDPAVLQVEVRGAVFIVQDALLH